MNFFIGEVNGVIGNRGDIELKFEELEFENVQALIGGSGEGGLKVLQFSYLDRIICMEV